METKDVLNEFLKTLLDGVKEAGAFMKDQLPMVLQEYIVWGVTQGIIIGVLYIGSSYGCYRALKWGWAKLQKDEYNDGGIAACITGAILGITSVILGIESLMQATKALVAPRVYLIEELSKLIH